MSQITTHVLDTSLGRPAAGVPVILEMQKAGGWHEISKGATDGDGRLQHLLEPGAMLAGIYRLTFETSVYFHARKIHGLYPQVTIEFQVADPKEHYHIPLLLSPCGYTTYRGS